MEAAKSESRCFEPLPGIARIVFGCFELVLNSFQLFSAVFELVLKARGARSSCSVGLDSNSVGPDSSSVGPDSNCGSS